ncbi:response regulator transcription factor [Elusimicrobiota bacterium]
MARVFVAEDEANLLALVYDNLEMAGYQIETARDGDEALQKIRASLPDIAILDLLMPKKTGWDVAKILKSDPKTSHIPIIILTASVSDEEIAKAQNLGIAKYIKKPYEPETVTAAIEEILKKTG